MDPCETHPLSIHLPCCDFLEKSQLLLSPYSGYCTMMKISDFNHSSITCQKVIGPITNQITCCVVVFLNRSLPFLQRLLCRLTDLLKEAYAGQALLRSLVFKWHRQFKEGREDAKSRRGKVTPRLVRTEENIELIRTLINDDRRKTIQELSSQSGINAFTIHSILHEDSQFSKMSAHWVSRLLNSEHKAQQIEMARDLKRRHFRQSMAFFKSVVTMDQSWVSFFTPEIKSQSMQWLPKGADPPEKAKVQNSIKKLMLIAFFDWDGMIYQHWFPEGQTINSTYYCEVIPTFSSHLHRKSPENFVQGWILHQDKARPHVSRETMEFFSKKIKTLPHAPYSPDLAPCNFWLFPQLKTRLAFQRFGNEEGLKQAVQGVLGQL